MQAICGTIFPQQFQASPAEFVKLFPKMLFPLSTIFQVVVMLISDQILSIRLLLDLWPPPAPQLMSISLCRSPWMNLCSFWTSSEVEKSGNHLVDWSPEQAWINEVLMHSMDGRTRRLCCSSGWTDEENQQINLLQFTEPPQWPLWAHPKFRNSTELRRCQR